MGLSILVRISIVALLLTSLLVHANSGNKAKFVDIRSVISDVNYDIKYFTSDNFVGKPITGYKAPRCLVHKKVINDLRQASQALRVKGYRFKFFDCYRPVQAVAHFMRWAKDLNDLHTKAMFYPNIDKSTLVGPYIAEKSGHSKGFTVDLTLEQYLNGAWHEVDMGSPFDMFDPISHTLSPLVNEQQQLNRLLLKNTLQQHGFTHYPMEWWHFTHTSTPKAERTAAYDFIVE